MIVWVDGAFASGKTTLAEELRRRLAGALLFDPEELGYVLQRTVPMPDSDDFQDLPLWRELTAAFLLAVRREYRSPVIVPMTLWNTEYRDEIFGRVEAGGERIRHVFLDVPASELARRIRAQVLVPQNEEADANARAFRLAHIVRGVAARANAPSGSLVLEVGPRTPAELADDVLSWAGLPGPGPTR